MVPLVKRMMRRPPVAEATVTLGAIGFVHFYKRLAILTVA